MTAYILKSGGCLLVFYLFYILFLEKENMHVYKRVYLLSILALSFVIPFITFTNYVEVVEQIQPMIDSSVVTEFSIIEEAEQQNYFSILLWSIYSLGVLLFGLKFIRSSFEIIKRIKNNPKEKNGETTSVLLNEDIVPHTFFNFIFFNKQQFISHQIPKEVILHEETHARQKHSIDVLVLEFLQVVFWFNPVLFLLNKAVKLNHEFLADQAVLNNGANTKTYQQTLLAYSSNASQLPLAHAINYSSIKKRFTVMKTHTSKKKIWIRSFILLPVLALLLFSFSTTIQQEKATPQQVTEYNTLAKKYNSQPKKGMVVKLKEVNRIEYLYKLMTPSQKKKAEKLPSFPPMPPSPKVIKGVNDTDSNIPPPPPLPKDAKYVLDNKKVSYDEASKLKNENIQSADIADKDGDVIS
ncbi:MAG: M56 family metallopeptidase [Flavobacteriaceae bacterium]|nr:M56 family metallopeptidase [Flavobacteriaceae bacterium]